MSIVGDTQPKLAAEIASLCIVLFDRWCEKRSVVPLAYLMHTWPIVKPTPPLIRRLSSTLRELVIFHADALDAEDHQMVRDVIEMANRLS